MGRQQAARLLRRAAPPRHRWCDSCDAMSVSTPFRITASRCVPSLACMFAFPSTLLALETVVHRAVSLATPRLYASFRDVISRRPQAARQSSGSRSSTWNQTMSTPTMRMMMMWTCDVIERSVRALMIDS